MSVSTYAPSVNSASLQNPLVFSRGVITSVKHILRKKRKLAIADEENVRLILEHDSNLYGIVSYNEFSAERILSRPIPDGKNINLVTARDLPRQWQDSDTTALQTYIQRTYIPSIPVNRIEAVVNLFARERCAFHPVRNYLQSLQWDGVSRIDTWLEVYLGANSQPPEYLKAVGTKYLISAVARILQPGCKADCVLVGVGGQGIGKSSAARTLFSPEFFSDGLPADLASKDSRDHLKGKWGVELPELSQFRRSEVETVKAFISRQSEQYRPAYGRNEVTVPRQCVFFGTTNEEAFLVDQTGNRRFWPVTCSQIDLDALKNDRDQLWAEAMERYRQNEAWHLTDDEAKLADQEAAERMATDPWLINVNEIVNISHNVNKFPTEMSPGEVMTALGFCSRDQHTGNSIRISKILIELGWTRGKKDCKRGRLYLRPATPNIQSDSDIVGNSHVKNDGQMTT